MVIYHFLSKIFVWLIYPLSIGILLIIISYIFYKNKKIKFFQPLLIVGLIIIYLPSITPIQRILFKSIHVNSFKISELNQIDAIVVLGGEPARSISGIRLYNKNIAPFIIMTGGSGNIFQESQSESDRMTDFLIEFGVEKNSILSEKKSRNTRENALFSKKIMDKHNIKKIALVTSNIHMKRSIKVFEKLDYDVFPYNSQIFRIPKKNNKFDPFVLFPNVENLFVSTQIIYEYFALFLYKIIGWI